MKPRRLLFPRPKIRSIVAIAIGAVVAAVLIFMPLLGGAFDIFGFKKPTWESVCAKIAKDWPRVRQTSTEELARMLEGPVKRRPILIDSRTAEEYAVSHLPGAIHAPTVGQAAAALRDAPPGAPVVFYCSVGVRSSKEAAEFMKAHGRPASNLRGSIFQWANEGRPVVKDGSKPAAKVHPFNARWGRLLDPKLRASGSGQEK